MYHMFVFSILTHILTTFELHIAMYSYNEWDQVKCESQNNKIDHLNNLKIWFKPFGIQQRMSFSMFCLALIVLKYVFIYCIIKF